MADILNIGKSGLMASKKSLETTGHNIANSNTEGYSRQRVMQTTNPPIVKYGNIEGTGTRIRSVERVHDENIEKRLNKTITDNSNYKETAEQLGQVENIYNEIDNDGLNKVLNKFYNSFRELANQPENETIRSIVRDQASLVVKDFKRINGTLEQLSIGIDNRIKAQIVDVNQLTRSIADLNKKIAYLEAVGDQTGDLRDERDARVRDLSENFKVSTYVDGKGNFNVSAVGIGTLVSGGHHQEMVASPVAKSESSNRMAGSVEIYFKDKPGRPITEKFVGGKISALITVRNDSINKLRQNTDTIAHEFIQTVNAVHRRGYVSRPVEADAEGIYPIADSKGPVTGINFFREPASVEGAAANIMLSDEVRADLSNIATSLKPNSAGDNRVAVAISKLQHERVMAGGTATLEESYLQTIGNIGLETNKARIDAEQSQGILAQIKGVKERISGVSIDEETANMVRYQHAYEASAKVMSAADEMFNTVLNIKR